MPGHSIIAMAPNAWSSPWRNRQHLLSRLARRDWTVVYSNGLLDSWQLMDAARGGAPLTGRVTAVEAGVRNFEQGLLPFRWASYPTLDRWCVRRHASRLLKQVGAPGVDVLLLFHPVYWPYVEWLKPRRLVYYMYDSLGGELAANPALARHWRDTMERADLLIATSEEIAKRMPDGARGRVRILNNGADVATILSLETAPCPRAIADIPRPRIGYSGAVNAKLDYALIGEIATREPRWHWVLVGPEIDFSGMGDQSWQRQALAREECRRLPNVHFVGALPYPEFLSVLHHMDVNVLCNRIDAGWWRHAYPLKFHEYLASGRPVVSSPIASIGAYAPVTEFARTADEWIAALRRAIEQGGIGSTASRREIAAGNDWEDKALLLESWLRETIGGASAHTGIVPSAHT